MGFGITKTIPQSRGVAAVNAWCDGSIDEFEFHMGRKLFKLSVGDYVYTYFSRSTSWTVKDQIFGI